MNYYEHHIGDYAVATAHLSLSEDGAYNRLMQKYYADEKPLVGDLHAIQRLVRAHSKEEKKAVETVLAEFFIFLDGCWHNKRCDREIARYKDKRTKAKASADARWSAQRTQSEADANAMRTHSEGNAHHTPDTTHQTPDPEQGFKHTPVDTPCDRSEKTVSACASPPEEKISPGVNQATQAGRCCATMMKQGIGGCNPSHPILLELIHAGASEIEFAGAARQAKGKGKANFSYVLGIVRRQREEAAQLVLHHGRMPNKQEMLEASNRGATEGWRPPEVREASHAN